MTRKLCMRACDREGVKVYMCTHRNMHKREYEGSDEQRGEKKSSTLLQLSKHRFTSLIGSSPGKVPRSLKHKQVIIVICTEREKRKTRKKGRKGEKERKERVQDE